MWKFSQQRFNKNISKKVETIKGFANVKSNGEKLVEIVKLVGEGIDNGDYYVCLNNELAPIKGKDIYKNVIVTKDEFGFYIDKRDVLWY